VSFLPIGRLTVVPGLELLLQTASSSNVSDRITTPLMTVAGKLHLSVSSAGVASASRGLVGDSKFAVLPEVTPLHCFALTAVTQIVSEHQDIIDGRFNSSRYGNGRRTLDSFKPLPHAGLAALCEF
jgi:hypothetical protein